MRLELSTPLQLLVDDTVTKVSAEGRAGSFTLLPHHVDFLTVLAPGILAFESANAETSGYVAVDEGVLVKSGDTVHVATRRAVRQQDVSKLEQAVAEDFARHGDEETEARAALHKLEADVVREFWQMEQQRHGR